MPVLAVNSTVQNVVQQNQTATLAAGSIVPVIKLLAISNTTAATNNVKPQQGLPGAQPIANPAAGAVQKKSVPQQAVKLASPPIQPTPAAAAVPKQQQVVTPAPAMSTAQNTASVQPASRPVQKQQMVVAPSPAAVTPRPAAVAVPRAAAAVRPSPVQHPASNRSSSSSPVNAGRPASSNSSRHQPTAAQQQQQQQARAAVQQLQLPGLNTSKQGNSFKVQVSI
jgi:hypothetical protein